MSIISVVKKLFGICPYNQHNPHLKITEVDFSKWDDGIVTEKLEDGSTITYTVEKDESGNPLAISNDAVRVFVL